MKTLLLYKLDSNNDCYLHKPEFFNIYYDDETTCLAQSVKHLRNCKSHIDFDLNFGDKSLFHYKVENITYTIVGNHIMIEGDLLEKPRTTYVEKQIKGEDGLYYTCRVPAVCDWQPSCRDLDPIRIYVEPVTIKVFEDGDE